MASLDTTVRGFFKWWLGELRASIPPGLRGGPRRKRKVFWVELGDGVARFGRETRGRVDALGEVTLRGSDPATQRNDIRRHLRRRRIRPKDLDLRLSRAQALRQTVVLPAATGENLREVLAFEMDRHTPFKADEVVFDYRIVRSDPKQKQIEVDLAVATKATLSEALETLRAWKLDPERVHVEGGGLDLLPSSLPPAAAGGRRRLTAALAVVALVLFAGAVLAPLQTQRDLLADAERELASARAAAIEVDNLRRQAEALADRNNFLVNRKRKTISVAALMTEVTRLLPDDTWIVQLSRREDQLTLSGFSAKASALIGSLEQSEILTDVRFRSPVNFDPRVKLERFNLSAAVAPRESAAGESD